MNVLLWALAGVLAALFLVAGGQKLLRPVDQLVAAGMGWSGDAPLAVVRFVGTVEVLGALGLVLPGVTGVAPVLVPLAATGLALVMVGAVVTHLRRGESSGLGLPVVLLVLAAVVAWGRFGPYAF